jgi:hypothetical protein
VTEWFFAESLTKSSKVEIETLGTDSVWQNPLIAYVGAVQPSLRDLFGG